MVRNENSGVSLVVEALGALLSKGELLLGFCDATGRELFDFEDSSVVTSLAESCLVVKSSTGNFAFV